jgi:hypothetical protein
MKWQLVDANEFDGWQKRATGGSSISDIAGTGFCKTTITKCPAACQKMCMKKWNFKIVCR